MALQHIRSNTADKRPVASSLADGQIAINYQADSPGAFFKDSAGNLVKVGPVHVGSTAPNATPAGSSGNSLGEAWLDNSGVDAILKIWDGTAWTPAKALVSGDIEITSINSGPLAGFRNAVINGGFDIFQRGSSYTGTVSGLKCQTADRWFLSGNSMTSQILAFTAGQTDVPGEPTYYFRNTWPDTLSNVPAVTQKIESVRTFAGQEVTLSFYAKTSTTPFSLSVIALVQNFGSGGSASATVATGIAISVAIGTSWQRYTYTVTLPSISGKTLDGNDDFLNLLIYPPANTICSLDLAQVQLEPGPIATPFERRPIGQEVLLCQRYFRGPVSSRAMGAGNYAVRYAGGAQPRMYAGHITLGQPMRAAPTLTLDTSSISYDNCSGLSTGTVTEDGAFFYVASTAAGPYYTASWTASFDAEL